MTPLSHRPAVVIYAKDADRVAAFYAAVLDAPAVPGDSYLVVESPAVQVVMVSIPAAIADSIVVTDPPVRRTETPVKAAFPVASIALVRAAVGPLGGVIDPPSEQWRFGDDVVCDGHDPEGNVIQLREPA